MLMPSEVEVDVEVNKADQERINEFGTLNAKKLELRDDIEEAKKALQHMEDAEEAIMMADDTPGSIRALIGHAFVDVTFDEANALAEKGKADATARIAALTDELKSLEARQGELKAQLYAKFGKSINLEDD